MRRLRDRTSRSLFRGAELPRLLTLVVMLGGIALLIGLARDKNTWRWLTPGADADPANEQLETLAPNPARDVAAEVAQTSGPTDTDPQEQDAAREEFQALTDKAALTAAEMPAYWRLVEWQLNQPAAAMLERADKDVTFNDLWHRPDKWRGKLVALRVHLNQVIKNADLADNRLDMKSIYEVYGWNTDSSPNWYLLVTPELPPGMPAVRKIYEEATFVGYFLKLQAYEDREGKQRAMPLLIGRLIWHPIADHALAESNSWTWPWYLAAVLAVLFALRWGLALSGSRRTTSAMAEHSARSDPAHVEAWLDAAQNSADDNASDEPGRETRTGGKPSRN